MFNQTNFFIYEGHQVLVTDVFNWSPESTERQLLGSAVGSARGALVFELSPKGVDLVKPLMDVFGRNLKDLKEGYVVMLDMSIMSVLTEEEQMAVLYHEFGHIASDHHCDTPEGALKEMEADTWAFAQGVNPKVLARALKKTLKAFVNGAQLDAKADKNWKASVLNQIYGSPALKERFKFLSN